MSHLHKRARKIACLMSDLKVYKERKVYPEYTAFSHVVGDSGSYHLVLVLAE